MPSITRRKFVISTIGGAVAAPWVARTIPQAHAQSKTLTVMMVGGTWGDAVKKGIGDQIASKYGATLRYDQRPNAQQIAAIQAMRNAPTVDTVELGSTRVAQAIALGLLSPINTGRVPSYADNDIGYKNPYYADRYVHAWSMTVDKKRVDPKQVAEQGWSILLDPNLKGRVAIPKFGWMGEMWMAGANISMGGTYENFDPIIEFCRKAVRENGALVMDSNDAGMKLFTTGEIVAAPFWKGRTHSLQDKGLSLETVYVKGWVVYGSGFTVVKGANEELAEKFVDLSLQPEPQLDVAKAFFAIPTNKHARAKLSDSDRFNIPQEALKIATALEFDKMYKHSDRHLERVNKEVLG